MISDYSQLLQPCIQLAQDAGKAILEIYQQENLDVTIKSDDTPLTKADLLANEIIVAGLQALTPNIPILSEELTAAAFAERSQWQQYWLIDPLDGTKEFIEKTDEFTVNIALVENHEPVLGVVYAPVSGIGYEAYRGFGAFKRFADGTFEFINTRPHPGDKIDIAISRRHGKKTYDYLNRFGEHELHYHGSAIKICLVAEGLVDIYPRLGPTSEWDTAAGQCILEEAGGRLMDFQGNELRYNTKDSTLNPEFLAVGDWQHDWLQHLDKS